MSPRNPVNLKPVGESRSLTLQAAERAQLPELIVNAGDEARSAFFEFFTATIENDNTRAAYARAVARFFSWCGGHGIQLEHIEPSLVAAYLKELGRGGTAPATRKQHLAAIRMLFDYLVQKRVLPSNPASVVRGPKHVVKKGKTPVLSREDARRLFESICTERIIDLRDRALIATMLFSFARVGAVTKMTRADYQNRGKKDWLILHEKGGKYHEVPAHHLTVDYLDQYLAQTGVAEPKAPLFQSVDRSGQLSGQALNRNKVNQMLKRRCRAAGLSDIYTAHSLRAAGITIYMENGGTLENAQAIAAHESPRTTKLYDRTSDTLSLSEIERIAL